MGLLNKDTKIDQAILTGYQLDEYSKISRISGREAWTSTSRNKLAIWGIWDSGSCFKAMMKFKDLAEIDTIHIDHPIELGVSNYNGTDGKGITLDVSDITWMSINYISSVTMKNFNLKCNTFRPAYKYPAPVMHLRNVHIDTDCISVATTHNRVVMGSDCSIRARKCIIFKALGEEYDRVREGILRDGTPTLSGWMKNLQGLRRIVFEMDGDIFVISKDPIKDWPGRSKEEMGWYFLKSDLNDNVSLGEL